MSLDLQIRPATEGDLESVRGVLVETWHDTYDALMGREKVVEITGKWHSVEVLARQLAAAGTSFLVAETEQRVVGHAFAHGQDGAALYLRRLYVLPSWQRQGIGEQLLAAILSRHPQSRMVRLNVETENAKAVAFYRRQGFRVTGQAMEGGMQVTQMEKTLDR
jgi:ribosomal protein S18 acetylase RimI-like enzyme